MGRHPYHKLPTDIQTYLDENSSVFIHFSNRKHLAKRLKSQFKRHGYTEFVGNDVLLTILHYWQAVIELHYPEKTNQDGYYYKDILKQMVINQEIGESIEEYRYILKALPQVVQHQYVENARGLLRQSLVFYKERLVEPGLLDHFLSKLNCNYSTEKARHLYEASRLIEHCDSGDDQTLWATFEQMAPTFWI
jgi:hypothetical protein